MPGRGRSRTRGSGGGGRRREAAGPSARKLQRELLRRRTMHQEAIAEIDGLLAALGRGRRESGSASPSSVRTQGEAVRPERVWRQALPVRKAAAALGRVAGAVAEAYGVEVAELRGAGREVRVVRPRQVAMSLAYGMTGCSQEQIGKYFGGRGQTAVFHACQSARKMQATDPKIDRLVAALRG